MPAGHADRLDVARRLLIGLVALWAVATLAVVIGGPVRSAVVDDPRPPLVRALGLTRPSLLPAGQPARTPAGHAAVEPGHTPGLDRLAPSPTTLLVPQRVGAPGAPR